MTAQINGVAWVAACIATSKFFNGVLGIAGSDNATNATIAQIIAFAVPTSGPGTFQVTPTNGVNGSLTVGLALWQANALMGSGTITVATLSATAASGTFSLSLSPFSGSPATGTKTITNGAFNITF